jgi:hypothetical protein
MSVSTYDWGTKKWFLGQVPPPGKDQHLKDTKWKDAYGDRVKVRIPGLHPMASSEEAAELSDSALPWAIVAKPTTSGHRNVQSTGICGGEWVIGFFMDDDCQIPVITHVLGNNINDKNNFKIKKSINGTTLGKPVHRFNTANPSINTQITSLNNAISKLNSIDSKFFNHAKTK